jgi:hypothetical protein
MNAVVDVTCRNCHGYPPPPPQGNHPQDTSCSKCHPFSQQTHMNAEVDVSCTGCHGYPPATMRSGAAHPQSSDCAACHGDTFAGNTHQNGRVELTAGSCSTCHGNPPANHAPTATNCATCHGANLTNGTHINGNVELLSGSCAGCHRTLPPSSGEHGEHDGSEFQCSMCHGPGFSRTTINAAAHMDGVRTVVLPSGITWNATRKTCTGTCHRPSEDHGRDEPWY